MAIKTCIGIDVSKDKLECCIGYRPPDEKLTFSKSKTFENTKKGHELLYQWAMNGKAHQEVLFVMEATGVYYEPLAYWLAGKEEKVSVLLPNMSKYFARSLNIKTKTDQVDAKMLSRMGLERKLDLWQLPSKLMREIKLLCREHKENKVKTTAIKNQRHARKHGYDCPENTLDRLEKQIEMIEMQVKEIEAELKTKVKSDPVLYARVQKLMTIPGAGFMTVVTVLAETNGFALVKNGKQLASYAGLDVQLNQSGEKKGKSRISKKGNSFIRYALHMPAICSSIHNPQMEKFYNRLIGKKPAKKIAITAVSRKLLLLIYTLWKNDTVYNPNYEQDKITMQESNGTSGHQEAKPLLRQKNKDEVRKKKIGRPKDLPTQDELLSDQSAEALLRPDKVKKKAAKVGS